MPLNKGSDTREAIALGALVLVFTLGALAAVTCGATPHPGPEQIGAVRQVSTPDTTTFTNLYVETDVTIGDDLTVTDDASFGDDVTITGDLSVSTGGSLDMNENNLIFDTDGDTIMDNNGTDDTARLRLGDSTTGTFTIYTGNLLVGNGTPASAQDGEDFYVEGKVETHGPIFANMGLDAVPLTAQAYTTQTLNLIVAEQSNGADVFSVGPTGATLVDLKADLAGLIVQGHSSQTASLFTAEQSNGTDVFTVSNTGAIVASGNATAASAALGGGYGSTGLTVQADGDLYTNGSAYVDTNAVVTGTLTAGLTYTKVDAIAKTASYTVTVAETGSLFTNAGATAEITLTLPAASEGLNYCFYVYAAYTVTLELDGADQVHHLTNAAGDRTQNIGTTGDSLCVVAADATYWLPVHETGTWSDAN